MTHFDEMTCLLYLEGQLERPRALELSAHAETCAECRALLRALENESHLLTRALAEEDEAVPARLLAPPARNATPWAWIISFGLAAAGAYTLWTGIIEPWREQLSQAGIGESSLLTLLLFRGAFWKGWGEMANMLQILAVTTLGILAFGLLRRRWRRWTTIAIVMGAVVAALGLPPAVSAAEIRHEQSYILSTNEVVKNDLIVSGRTVRIDGTVEGDLIVFCQSLTVNGHVAGDVIAFSHFIRLNGPVDGNVRAFVNTAALNSIVAKNVNAFAQNFELDSKAQVNGGAMLFVSQATLDGRVGRDVLMGTGHGQLNGFIGGNARIHGERLNIGPTAQIAGKASFRGRYQPEVSPTAKLASPLAVEIVRHRPAYTRPGYYWKQALAFAAAFIFGMVLILLMPGFVTDVVRSTRHYGPALGFGALVLFATPILAIIACVTIIGLAVGIGGLLLWLIGLYSAQVFVGAWLGEALMGPSVGTGALIGRLAVGLLLIRIVGALPFIGPWAKLFIIIWGLGALALGLFTRTRVAPVAVLAEHPAV